MAGLFGQAITVLCLSTATGTYNEACNKAVDAGTRQLGWREQVDFAEDKANEIVNRAVTAKVETLGQKTMSIMGVGGYVLRVVRDRKISFILPTLGLCSSLSNEITPDSYRLNVNWNFK